MQRFKPYYACVLVYGTERVTKMENEKKVCQIFHIHNTIIVNTV